MSHRQLITRRAPMDLYSPRFEGAPVQTSADANKRVVVAPSSSPTCINITNNKSNDNQWGLGQQLGSRDHDSLLLGFPPPTDVTSRRFTLWDLLVDTAVLTRSRGAYFLLLVPTILTGMVLLHILIVYFAFENREYQIVSQAHLSHLCEKTILHPWVEAAISKNLSSARQEEFYQQYRQNCSMFENPVTELGTFFFKNGTVTLRADEGLRHAVENPFTPACVGIMVAQIVYVAWTIWGGVAVAWGLHVATTTTTSRQSRPKHPDLDPDRIHMLSQALTQAFTEQISYRAVQGFTRAILTAVLSLCIETIVFNFIATVRLVAGNTSESRRVSFSDIQALTLAQAEHRLWTLANPVAYLFLLSLVAAALEPGVWGFKALRRGVQLMRGNWLKCYAVFLVMFLSGWLSERYLEHLELPFQKHEIRTLPGAMTPLVLKILYSMWRIVLVALLHLPGYFLLPVLYFLCKLSLREKWTTKD